VSAPAKLRKLEKTRDRELAGVERRRKDEVNDHNLEKDESAKKAKVAKVNRKFAEEKTEKNEKFEDEVEELTDGTKKEVNSFVREANTAFATYRKDRGDFNGILKDTAKKMHKMVDSKSKDNKAIAQLQDMLKKKVKPAAEAYGKNLEKCDKQIMDILKRLAGNRVSKTEVADAMPKPALGNALFKEFKDVKNHMKREKIQ
jgi:ABC-type transporter Mla subunit MlaD